MNNCHLWILKIYQVDIRNIHYPWYIDGIRKNIRYRILLFLHSVRLVVLEFSQNPTLTRISLALPHMYRRYLMMHFIKA